MCPSPPKLSKYIELTGWLTFFITILLVIMSLMIQGNAINSSDPVWWLIDGKNLIKVFPWWLLISLSFSAVCTFAAATKFNERYTHLSKKASNILLNPEGASEEDIKLKNEKKYTEVKQDNYLFLIRNKHLPEPYYGLEGCYIHFDLSEYLEYLLKERASARAAAGKIAAALGGASIAGILAFSRLAQSLHQAQ